MNLLTSILTVNLESKLIAANRRALSADTAILAHQSNMDAQIERLRLGAEATVEAERLDAAAILGFQYKTAEAAIINRRNASTAHLPQERVFTTEAIKALCCRYGLRCLPTRLYKGALDTAIPERLAEFKALNGGKLPTEARMIQLDGRTGTLDTFFICAPSASFVLSERPKDPLLFAYLGDERWYLIHKWGQDLSVGARVKNWICAESVVVAALVTWLTVFFLFIAPLMVSTHTISERLFATACGGGLSSLLLAMIFCMILNDTNAFSSHVDADNWDSPFTR